MATVPALVAFGALGAFACLRPTEITLRLDTDVECSAIVAYGTSIFGGAPAPGDPPIASTLACSGDVVPHAIGTLVVTPTNKKDDVVTLTVVAGVERPVAECAAHAFAGCVVARRRLRYVAHEPLELPVRLARACVGVACADDETCVEGKCTTANVDDPAFCTGGPGCGTPPILADGGGDAGVSPSDAGSTDAADGGGDAGDGGAQGIHKLIDGGPAKGVAADAKGLVWGSAESASVAALNTVDWTDAFAPTPRVTSVVLPSFDKIAGVATDGTTVWVAGRLNGGCVLSTDRTTFTATGSSTCSSGVGYGVDWFATPDFGRVATQVTGELVYAPGSTFVRWGNNGVANGSSYIEVRRLTSDAYWGVGNDVRRTPGPFSNPNPPSVTVGTVPDQVAGIGLGAQRVYVTTRTSVATANVFALLEGSPAVPLGYVAGAEDLVVWRSRGPKSDLFVAGSDGIYVLDGVE